MHPEANTRLIPLTQGFFAIVDAEDWPTLSVFRWHALRYDNSHTFYAARTVGPPNRRRKLWMHHAVMDVPNGATVDHIDRNGLNNRRSNLRVATRGQQMMNRPLSPSNSSGYRGVFWLPRASRWYAAIYAEHRRHHLGSFTTREEAAHAYDVAALRLHGQFAQLNFPHADTGAG